MGADLTIAEIQARVCARYDLRAIDLLSQRRGMPLARHRQVAMYLAKELTPRSFPIIGREFGGRDHTTVMHACRRIEELRLCDMRLDADLRALARDLSSPRRQGLRLSEGAGA